MKDTGLRGGARGGGCRLQDTVLPLSWICICPTSKSALLILELPARVGGLALGRECFRRCNRKAHVSFCFKKCIYSFRSGITYSAESGRLHFRQVLG